MDDEHKKLEAWYNWKRHCNLYRCSDEEQHYLGTFATNRYAHYMKMIDRSLQIPSNAPATSDEIETDGMFEHVMKRRPRGGGASMPKARPRPFYRCWHLFEAMAVTRTIEAEKKTYKDYLFYRLQFSTDPNLKVIHGLFKAMMRDVARKDYLDNYTTATNTRSVEHGVADRIDLMTESALLSLEWSITHEFSSCAPPDVILDNKFLNELTRKVVSEWIDSVLSDREKAVMLGFSLRLQQSHPKFMDATGVTDDTILKIREKINLKLKKYFEKKFPNEYGTVIRTLVPRVFSHLPARLEEWARSASSPEVKAMLSHSRFLRGKCRTHATFITNTMGVLELTAVVASLKNRIIPIKLKAHFNWDDEQVAVAMKQWSLENIRKKMAEDLGNMESFDLSVMYRTMKECLLEESINMMAKDERMKPVIEHYV
jgi:hypothetical protein